MSPYACRADRKENDDANNARRRANPALVLHDRFVQDQYKKKHREKMMLHQAQKRSRMLGVPCDLVEGDIIIPDRCPLLGIVIVNNGRMNNRDSSPSLDRFDPLLGYTKDNVWVISYRANRIKNNATPDELDLIARNLRMVFEKRQKLVTTGERNTWS